MNQQDYIKKFMSKYGMITVSYVQKDYRKIYKDNNVATKKKKFKTNKLLSKKNLYHHAIYEHNNIFHASTYIE